MVLWTTFLTFFKKNQNLWFLKVNILFTYFESISSQFCVISDSFMGVGNWFSFYAKHCAMPLFTIRNNRATPLLKIPYKTFMIVQYVCSVLVQNIERLLLWTFLYKNGFILHSFPVILPLKWFTYMQFPSDFSFLSSKKKKKKTFYNNASFKVLLFELLWFEGELYWDI